MNSDEPFLKRWSRRKVEAKESVPPDGNPEADGEAGARVPEQQEQGETTGKQADAQETRLLTEADFADVDFEALDAQSDYSRFLVAGVPDSIKYRALRKLWTSDPILSQIEPFQEWAGDFTDAAVAVPAGTLKTAYRVGKGFMTDEDVAEWEKLGKPVEEKVATAPPPGDGETRVAHDTAGAGDQTAAPRAGEGTADASGGGGQRSAGASEAAHDGKQVRSPAEAAAVPEPEEATGGDGARQDKGTRQT